jgi:L-2-hydroxyglutarate oxidase LhgO
MYDFAIIGGGIVGLPTASLEIGKAIVAQIPEQQ